VSEPGVRHGQLVLNFYRLLMALACVAMVAAFGIVLLGILARR
jgi:TRAP-type C4-dicarboxylate transport system permease small subunit